MKALRVDGSRAAPFFELVAKPNDWQKAVKAATTGQESVQSEAYRTFWTPLRDAFEATQPALVKGRTRPRSIWFAVNSPIPKAGLYGEIGSGELRVCLDISTGDRAENLRLLQKLEVHQAALEAQLGELDFDPGGQRCKIVSRRTWPDKLLDQPERHDDAREWFRESLLKFEKAFRAIGISLDS